VKFFDNLHNQREFRKYNVKYDIFPVIYGKIMFANFAKNWNGSVKIGKNVTINSSIEANPVGGINTTFLFKGDNAVIEIDDATGISNALFASYEHIYIGKNVAIGAGTRIFDTDFHSINYEERMRDVNIPHKPVRIEKGVFIGASAIILKGVVIGEYSVVGAGSVVVKSIPPGEIWGGNPAKFIKKL
jgi:acetyltransferase-like isoleucine patch superfamily enzyme